MNRRPLTFPTPCDSCDPCKGKKKIEGNCVVYTGSETSCLHIPTNTTFNDVVRILDEAICEASGGAVDINHVHKVLNSAGATQFTYGINEGIRFEGTGGTTISFDPSTKKVIIHSLTAEEVGDILITNNDFITNLGDTLIANETFINNIYDLVGSIFQDTNTIDFTYDSVTNIVTADVLLSSTPNNAIQAFSDGLWSPLTVSDGLIYGGQVIWQGTGYDYKISAAGYYINFQFHESPDTFVSLAPADATFDRIDSFVVDNTGTAFVITGIPSDNPAEPPIDTATQFRLGSVLVQAGSTSPVQDECLYVDNSEWTGFSSSIRINLNNTSSPCSGSKDILGTNVQDTDYFTLTRSTAVKPYAYQSLSFSLKSTGSWGNKSLTLRWYNGSTPVGNSVTLANNSYGFKSSITTSCQPIIISISDFNLTSADSVDNLRITANAPSGTFGWHIDSVCLVTGLLTPPTPQLTFDNGLTRTGDNVQFGGTLVHDTTLSTEYNRQIFTGYRVYDYNYEFEKGAHFGFQNGTGLVSFKHPDNLSGAFTDNLVRLGINYTSDVYQSTPSLISGYMGDKIGYWIGTNATGNGSYGLKVDDPNSKISGVFFHTLDTSYTDAVTFFGKHSPNPNFQGELSPSRIVTMHDDGDLTFYGYPSSRNDGGTASRFLTTDINGKVQLVDVDLSSVTGIYPTAIAFSGTNTKTLTLTLSDASTLTASFTDLTTSGGTGLADAYVSLTDGTNSASAVGGDIIKFRSGNNLLDVLVTDNDVTHGDNVLYTVNTTNLTTFVHDNTIITADNGLTANTPTNVRLGGTLLQNTTINASSFILTITKAGLNQALNVVNTGGQGLGVSGTSIGAAIQASGTNPLWVIKSSGSTSTVERAMLVQKTSTGATSSGVGLSIDFGLTNSINSTNAPYNQIISKLLTTTSGSEVSEFSITGTNGVTVNTLLSLRSDGQARLNKYGSNTFTGTLFKLIGEDSSGYLIEVDPSSLGGGGTYTDEQAQDAVGATLTDTASVDLTYDDAANEIKADVKDSYFKVTEIRFIAGYTGAMANVGDTTFTLVDCSDNPVINKKIVLYRNRYRQFLDYDYTYDSGTGEIVLAGELLEGETLIFECYPVNLWDECTSGTAPVGFPYVFPASFG